MKYISITNLFSALCATLLLICSSSMASEKNEVMDILLSKLVTKCDDSYIFYPAPEETPLIAEYKHATATLEKDTLSEADLLNGVKLKGIIIVKGKLVREKINNNWTKWNSYGQIETKFSFKNQNGSWIIRNGRYNSNFKKLSCGEIESGGFIDLER